MLRVIATAAPLRPTAPVSSLPQTRRILSSARLPLYQLLRRPFFTSRPVKFSMSSSAAAARALLATPVPSLLPSPRYPAKFTSLLPADEISSMGHDDDEDSDQMPVPDSILQTPRMVRNAVYSFVNPEDQSKNGLLLSWNKDFAATIGMEAGKADPNSWSERERQELIKFLTGGGKSLPRSDETSVESGSRPRLAQPWAHCYGGHQFGYYAGQLGDGRAISLYETVNPRTGESWELQLKGAGKTPYSRFADGYAVLRSSIREYLCAEAVAALNVASSRSLAILSTETNVIREEGPEPGSIVCRVAPSWIRFGSFEIFFYRKDRKNLRRLAEYVCTEVYNLTKDDPQEMAQFAAQFRWATFDGNASAPHADATSSAESETKDSTESTSSAKEDKPKPMYKNRFARMLGQVAERTAIMVSGWQSIGFCHGVMNTDNMSILGLTIDYGPYAFLDKYDPSWICNHSDSEGRYSFQQQPAICLWNLGRLALTLENLIGAQEKVDDLDWMQAQESDPQKEKDLKESAADIVVDILNTNFRNVFLKDYRERMNAKMGLAGPAQDEDLIEIAVPALAWMDDHEVDFHSFFRTLAEYRVSDKTTVDDNMAQVEQLVKTLVPPIVWEVRGEIATKEAKDWMLKYHARLIQSEESRNDQKRRAAMNRVNPAFVLRNWVAQRVIERVTKSVEMTKMRTGEEDPDKDLLEKVLWMCQNPYGTDDITVQDTVKTDDACEVKRNDAGLEAYGEFVGPVPEWGQGIQCSCSS